MTDLDKLRDELAEKHAKGHREDCVETARCSFKLAWDCALHALTEAAGDFDKVAALDIASDHFGDPDYANKAVRCMRAQFEQDAARIGMAESRFSSAKAWIKELDVRIESVKHFFDDAQKHCGELIEKNTHLEARLAESEQQRKVCVCCRRDLDEGAGKSFPSTHAFNSLQDKLTAAEAESADRMCKLVLLQARVKELEDRQKPS